MDRPKHRRFTLLGIALLLGGALRLLGRNWTSAPETPSRGSEVEPVTKRLAEPTLDRAEPPPVAEATANAAPSPSAAAPSGTFRGRAIDAVTRHPVQEFEITLAGVQQGQIVG